MTADVSPELLRRVLEALRRLVMASLRMEDGEADGEAEDSAEELIGAIDEALRPVPALAAASGPDAGTGATENEKPDAWIAAHHRAIRFLRDNPRVEAVWLRLVQDHGIEGLGMNQRLIVAPSLRSLAEAMDIPVPDAPEERGHKWSDAAVAAAMDAPPCKSEKVSNPRVCGYCTRNMLSAALAVDFPALVSAAAPEERDGELDDLLNALTGCVERSLAGAPIAVKGGSRTRTIGGEFPCRH